MKSFDEWLDTTKLRGYMDESSLEAAWEAGQQSKQAEIDALKAKADICERLRDSQFDKLWNLTQAIERARVGADEDFDLFLNHLSNILKGE